MSTRSVIALRHVPFEDLGLLAPMLTASGWAISYRDAPLDDLSDPAIADADLLIVLGGPIGVYETDAYPFLHQEIALLERRLKQNRPTLGICLGAQLMARALGARVYAGPVKEIGWGSLRLTEAGAASCLNPLGEDQATVLHWHGDTFDLPEGATRLASNENYPNQAFACGNNALALQFHAEADPRQLEQWYVAHTTELTAARVSIPALRQETARVAARIRIQAHRIFSTWLGQFPTTA
jgi:GMP synthase (glutamine-hydrolysing)